MIDASLSVGKVARRCGVNISTLHFYESKGLIYSWRNPGNQRRYNKEVLRRVSLIKAAQKMGITLAEIREHLATIPINKAPTKRDWQRLSRHWKESLEERIAYLERLRDNIDGCIGCGCLSMTQCPLRNNDDYLALRGTGPIILEGLDGN